VPSDSDLAFYEYVKDGLLTLSPDRRLRKADNDQCTAAELNDCRKMNVPADICYLRFGDGQVNGSGMLEYETVRGERLIVDLDAGGKLVGVELIGPGKPCQEL
jgi:hypothetical protein